MAKITDPLLEPYFIGKDSHCYTVYESVAPKKTRKGKTLKEGDDVKIYEKPQGHYNSFGSALEKIAKEQLINNQEHYESIQEYISKWDELRNKLKTLLNYKEL
jgi:bifunctional DNA-binding transcriptional regulator/antitoxin component of YhaV-PrlF toxin-antitoxin module